MIKSCIVTEVRGNEALVSTDRRSVYIRLKNRRIWIQKFDNESVQIDTTLLIDPTEADDYRWEGFTVKGNRIAKNTAIFSEEAFDSIVTCYLLLKEIL